MALAVPSHFGDVKLCPLTAIEQDLVKGTPKTMASLCNQINRNRFSSAEQPQSGEEDI